MQCSNSCAPFKKGEKVVNYFFVCLYPDIEVSVSLFWIFISWDKDIYCSQNEFLQQNRDDSNFQVLPKCHRGTLSTKDYRGQRFCLLIQPSYRCLVSTTESTLFANLFLKPSSRKSCSICLFMWVFFFYWCGVSQWLIFICYNILVTLELIQLYHGVWSSLLLDSVY